MKITVGNYRNIADEVSEISDAEIKYLGKYYYHRSDINFSTLEEYFWDKGLIICADPIEGSSIIELSVLKKVD